LLSEEGVSQPFYMKIEAVILQAIQRLMHTNTGSRNSIIPPLFLTKFLKILGFI
jgi:hypothetical protein